MDNDGDVHATIFIISQNVLGDPVRQCRKQSIDWNQY